MSVRRTVVVASILLLPLAGLVRGQPQPPPSPEFPPAPATETSPIAGQNAISELKVERGSGTWKADFDYFFTGDPRSAALDVTLTPQPGAPLGPAGLEQYQTFLPRPERGAHHASVDFRYPGNPLRTLKVTVAMRSEMFSKVILASAQVDQVIDWPDFQTWTRDQLIATASPQDNFKRAVGLIDTEGEAQLHEAKTILEKLIANDPKFAPAYIELARIAMKSNWGTEGLHQAEGLLSSALQIQPDSVNAKILLGYVYAHQERFDKAEALFTQASHSETNNLWLWSNWGEMLTMEGKPDQAILKYRQAIAHPMTHDTYDRARAFAYEHLLELLEKREDVDQMETLYKQRIAEFGPGSCYSTDYTRFLLDVRGDTQGAIDLATRALNQNCDDSESRELLGLAEYVKWASSKGPQQAEALNQAHVYLPAGPKPLYLLATSERTAPAARALVAAGEAIDQKDNDNLNALAYAVQKRDSSAAKRLLELGARPDTPVGEAGIPVAFLPVVNADAEGVRIMRQHGANYSTLRFRGATAFDLAKRMGGGAVLEALGANEADL
jgi:tetratricopeptide (TPR) repeat protein